MSVSFSVEGSTPVVCPSAIAVTRLPGVSVARVRGEGALFDTGPRLRVQDAIQSGEFVWSRPSGHSTRSCPYWFAIVRDGSGGADAWRLEDLELVGLVDTSVGDRLRSGQEGEADREYRRRVQSENIRRADSTDAAFRAAHPTGFVEIAADEARSLGRKVLDLLGEAKDAVLPGAPTLFVAGLVALAFVAVSRR